MQVVGRPLVEASILALAVLLSALFVTEPSSFILVASGILLTLGLTSFDLFVYAMIFLLPWYPLPDFNLPMRDIFFYLHVFLFAGVWMIRRRKRRPVRDWLYVGSVNKAVLLYAIIATISLTTSNLRTNIDAYRSLIRLFSYLLFFFAITGWLESRVQVYRAIRLLLFSTILVALFGFYQAFAGGYTDLYFQLYPLQRTGTEDWSGRITSFLFHFNSLAGYLELVIPFSIAYAFFGKTRAMQYLGVTCFSASSLALYLTGSRGGILAWGGIILFSIWSLRQAGIKILRIVIPVITISAVLVGSIMLLNSKDSERSSRLQELDEFTAVTRLELWGAAAAMFLEHPVLGVGYGNYRSSYGDYVPQEGGGVVDAHELYLEILAETGLIGFGIFGFIFWTFLRYGVKLVMSSDQLYRIVGLGVVGALIGTLIHGFVDFFFHINPQFGGLFWLILALALVAFESSKQDQIKVSLES